MVASEPVAAGVAWFEACRVELQLGMLADWVEVVEVEAVICGVLDCVVVDWHTAQPADCMLCLALCEECCFVFLELAACLACSSWHTITALWCFGLESNQRMVWDALISYHGHSKNHEAMAGKVSVLGICAIPCALPLSYRSWI